VPFSGEGVEELQYLCRGLSAVAITILFPYAGGGAMSVGGSLRSGVTRVSGLTGGGGFAGCPLLATHPERARATSAADSDENNGRILTR
jgi:hypothetical protein